MSRQHLLWTLLTSPVHTAPRSSYPLHQSDLPWDPHPHQCSHCHFSWDCRIGLLQDYESNFHILLSFQFILNQLLQGKHPIGCSSSLSKLQLFFTDSPYTTALILQSTILSRNFNIWLSNVAPLFVLGHAHLPFFSIFGLSAHSSFLCELPLSLAGVQQLICRSYSNSLSHIHHLYSHFINACLSFRLGLQDKQ